MLPRLLLLAALLLPASAIADEAARKDVADKIRMARVWMLTDALELDEATAAKLFPSLRETDQAVEAIQQRKRQGRKALRRMLEAGTFDEAEVDRLVDDLTTAEVELVQAEAARIRGLDRILTPEQRIKYLLVRAKLDEKVRELVRETRKERRERRERRLEERRE